jgi:hypothetical protein
LHLDIHLHEWLKILTLEDLALYANLALAFLGFLRREHLIQCLQLTYQGCQPLTQDLREGKVTEELPGLWHR